LRVWSVERVGKNRNEKGRRSMFLSGLKIREIQWWVSNRLYIFRMRHIGMVKVISYRFL